MKTLIIIPTYNEEQNIQTVVDNLIQHYSQYDYCVINDCSTDHTLDICKSKGYHYISLCTNLGIGGGVQTGYLYAVENNYDVTVQIDGDGQHDPSYIAQMIEVMQTENADMVIGSRFLEKKGFQTSASRRMGIRIINSLIYLCCCIKITDSTSGLRVCSKRITKFFADYYAQDYPEPEAIVTAALHGYKVIEYSVAMKKRIGGSSSINLKRSIYYMFKVTFAILLQKLSALGDRNNGY